MRSRGGERLSLGSEAKLRLGPRETRAVLLLLWCKLVRPGTALQCQVLAREESISTAGTRTLQRQSSLV